MRSAVGSARSDVPEIGWYSVVSDQPDRLAEGPWLQWHDDVVTVPAGAVEIARSEVGPQGWTYDRNLATQFHPEATESMLAKWSAGTGAAELERVGSSRDELMELTRSNVAVSRRHANVLVDWFLEDVAARPHVQPVAER